MMKRFREVFRHEEGFTLIELLVVIAVLGILAAIAVPRLTGVQEKARLAEATASLGTYKNAIEMYFVENGNYSVTSGNIDADHELSDYVEFTSIPDGWTFSVTPGASTYTITATGTGADNSGLFASIDDAGNVSTTQ